MQTLARLGQELRTSAIANLAIGDAALLASALRVERPGATIMLFVTVNVVLAVIWSTFGASGRARKEVSRAPVAPTGATIETLAAGRRRTLIGLLPVTAVLAVLVVIAPESAAVIAGVPAGVGTADLWFSGWISRFERKHGDHVVREIPSSPFAAGPRSVYTRPMNEATDET